MNMSALKKVWKRLRAFSRDEQGATMVEYVLMVAFVGLPLLAVALIFRNELWEMVSSLWEDVQSQQDVGS